jgi:hypothetical protein
MRPLLFLLLLPLTAAAQDPTGTVRRWSEAQALTRSAPTASCLAASSPEGMDWRSVRGFYVRLEADSGQTLSGAGDLRAWRYDFTDAAWVRVPELDLAVPAGASGLRRYGWGERSTVVRTGCVLYAADSVTVSSGTVTVRITAWTGGA